MAPSARKTDLGGSARKEKLEIGITAADRDSVGRALSNVLAASYRLLIKSHVYHWNVVGPLFMPFHQLTEQHYENLFAATDELAERVRALGFPAPHATSAVMELGRIGLDKTAVTRAMIEDLIADHEELSRIGREAAKTAEEADDFASHDLLVGRLAFHEKAIWMLKAIAAQ